MNEATQSPRERAHELIRQALKTGIRGELRDVLQHAERPCQRKLGCDGLGGFVALPDDKSFPFSLLQNQP